MGHIFGCCLSYCLEFNEQSKISMINSFSSFYIFPALLVQKASGQVQERKEREGPRSARSEAEKDFFWHRAEGRRE